MHNHLYFKNINEYLRLLCKPWGVLHVTHATLYQVVVYGMYYIYSIVVYVHLSRGNLLYHTTYNQKNKRSINLHDSVLARE